MAKTILIDVDGTLIDEYQRVPDSARRALAAASKAGHRLMLCTGRSIPELYPWLWDLGFTGLVGASGAYVSFEGRVISDRRINGEELRRAMGIFRRHGVSWIWQAPEAFYPSESFVEAFIGIQEDSPWAPYGRQIAPYLDYGDPPSASKATFVLPETAGITIEELDRELGETLRADPGTVQTGVGMSGEILMSAVSKATGLEIVATHIGIPIEDTIAIGDSVNDVEVVRAAGIGVAMGNARDEVKEQADFVTDPIDDDGLAKALERLGLVERGGA